MKIAIASDHAGFLYKEQIKALLTELGHEVRDFGTSSEAPVDYPAFIRPAAEAVARGVCDRGIVLGGSGNGEAIAANKVKGIRCALVWSLQTARWAREHNDANVLAIGQRTITAELAIEIVRVWLQTDFAGGRHATRIKAIEG
jgi:ribose 5-phosphate isomerase B